MWTNFKIPLFPRLSVAESIHNGTSICLCFSADQPAEQKMTTKGHKQVLYPIPYRTGSMGLPNVFNRERNKKKKDPKELTLHGTRSLLASCLLLCFGFLAIVMMRQVGLHHAFTNALFHVGLDSCNVLTRREGLSHCRFTRKTTRHNNSSIPRAASQSTATASDSYRFSRQSFTPFTFTVYIMFFVSFKLPYWRHPRLELDGPAEIFQRLQ